MKRTISSGKGSAFEIIVTFDDANLSVKLPRFADRLGNFKRFFVEYFAPQFFNDIQKNFAAEGRYVGGWRALSPRYAAWKLRHFGPLPKLVRSGTMLESLSLGGRFNVNHTTKTGAVFGSDVPYVKYHQTGTRRMPKRQVIWIGPSRVYQRLLNQFVRDEARSAGLRVA